MDGPQYKALLIGNGVFQKDPHNLPSLKGPKNDLRILEQTLSHSQVGLFKPENITLLLDQPRAAVTREIEKFFAHARRDDQLLFYYSGHGLLDTFNHLYLCAADTETDSLISTAISDEVVNSMIRQTASTRKVIILDCCHSGRFKGGLPDNLCGEGRFVLTSTRARELAVDAPEADAPSVFTRFLTEALLSGEVDTNNDGYVSVNEVYDFVLNRIVNETRQRPQRKFDDAVGEVALGRCTAKPKTKIDRPITREPVVSERPVLNVSETNIELTDVEPTESLPDEIIDVFNTGGGELDWTVTCEQDWIELEKQKQCFVLRFAPHPGINRARVLVRDKGQGGSKRIQVKVHVNEEQLKPKLALSETSVDFGEISQSAQPPSHSVRIINEGGGELNLAIAGCDNWIEPTIRGDILELRVDTGKPGKKRGVVRLVSDGGNAAIPVTVDIGKGPVLSVKPEVVNFLTVAPGSEETKTVNVSNSGGGSLNWNYETTGDFFTVDRDNGHINVSLNCNTPGTHNGAIVITSNGGEFTIPVRVLIKAEVQPQQAPRNVGADISGTWSAPGALVEFARQTDNQYQFLDKNEMGIVVGQGVAVQNGNVITLNGNHAVFGPYSATLMLFGNQMTGQAAMAGQRVPLTLQRGNVAGGGNFWNMIGQMFQ